MEEKTTAEQLHDLVDARFERESATNILARFSPPFDTSRPNIHDSKKDFLLEQGAVKEIVSHLQGILTLQVKPEAEETPEHREMISRLSTAIEISAIEATQKKYPATGTELALKNITDTGFYHNSLVLVVRMLNAYKKRLSDLNDQELEFWNVSHRPPNYYARTIALRFARYYAQETGTKPTFGTSRDGPHPSTDYGRILEEIFQILEIDSDFKRAAEWAVPQITEEDWNPPRNALMGGLFGMMNPDLSVGRKTDAKKEIVNALTKGF